RRRLERAFEQPATFDEVAVVLPEPPDSDTEAQRPLGLPGLERERHRSPQVAVLCVVALVPVPLVRPVELRLGRLREVEEVVEMAPTERVLLAALGKLLRRVFAHRVQHREPRLRGAALANEALVDQRAHAY